MNICPISCPFHLSFSNNRFQSSALFDTRNPFYPMQLQSSHKAYWFHIGYIIKIKLLGEMFQRKLIVLPGSREGEGFCGFDSARIYSWIPEMRFRFVIVWHFEWRKERETKLPSGRERLKETSDHVSQWRKRHVVIKNFIYTYTHF